MSSGLSPSSSMPHHWCPQAGDMSQKWVHLLFPIAAPYSSSATSTVEAAAHPLTPSLPYTLCTGDVRNGTTIPCGIWLGIGRRRTKSLSWVTSARQQAGDQPQPRARRWAEGSDPAQGRAGALELTASVSINSHHPCGVGLLERLR